MKTETVKTERLRKFFNMQYVMIKRTAPVGSLILLILSNSLLLASFFEHRIHPYISTIIMLFVFGSTLWAVSYIWTRKMEMYRTEKLAEMKLNPYAIYAIAPFEEMRYRNMELPIMRSLCSLLPDGEEKKDIERRIELIEGWCDRGFIPKGDFPKHLRKYYFTDKQSRL